MSIAEHQDIDEKLRAIINPLPNPRYTVDASFRDVEKMLAGYSKDWGLNLDPDFQRGHVWNEDQQRSYVEAILRGTIIDGLNLIQFNAPHWEDEHVDTDLPHEIQIVDGLQRLTAIRKFMDGDVLPFGLHVNDLEESSFSPKRHFYKLRFAVHNFTQKKDLLQFYLDINSGGTPHADTEIDRIKLMLAKENTSKNTVKPRIR